jgi:predicted adenine nucleotide alpha hydrolase (AANH) superfamily ATPase
MLLLHTCCAPCSAAILEWLAANGERVTLYYFNPNIYPETEYLLRKNECTRYAEKLGIDVIDGDYNHSAWLRHIAGHENEPERGTRCQVCFKMRLLATARLAGERGFSRFATTLAASRWKNLEQIAQAGHWAAGEIGDITFWEKNWRKDGLSERRNTLLTENGFYNQTWCGCEFSVRNNVIIPNSGIITKK